MQITRPKSIARRTVKCLQNGKPDLLLAKSKDTNSTDCDTYNECMCIYGPEFGSYCSNSDVGLVEINAEINVWYNRF